MELIAPCHFGLEAVLKREIIDLGYDISKVEDGRVTFHGDEDAVCRANIFLRTAERILIKIGSFHAETFDELFEVPNIRAGRIFRDFRRGIFESRRSSPSVRLSRC